MKILIAGGSGFLGTALAHGLRQIKHQVIILTRRKNHPDGQIWWDGRSAGEWTGVMNDVDAVVNLTGHGLEHWPWTRRQKKKFLDSRVEPGQALVSAIRSAVHPPGIFIQTSGINRYGLRRNDTADESTPAADDFLAQITVQWENATRKLDEIGVRRIITRNAPVLARKGGLFSLMTLPTRLFFGGKFGDGDQAFPWIHIVDYVEAIKFLLQNRSSQGPYNLIAPGSISNAEFMRKVAKTLRRPYWFHPPAALLRIPLGEMSVLLTEGSYSKPKRLLELGYKFLFPEFENAAHDILR